MATEILLTVLLFLISTIQIERKDSPTIWEVLLFETLAHMYLPQLNKYYCIQQMHLYITR